MGWGGSTSSPVQSLETECSHLLANSFFSNTGAVAGVFTVVGLVAVVIIVAVITNAIRRRRAEKLDREIAEAAAEAAQSQPAFMDDDYYPDDRRPGGAGSGGGDVRSMTTGYSDTTHGTFAQQPMGHGESYNMAELSPYDYGAGAGVAGAAGAAGIGAMGLNRARSMGTGNQSQPYGAFAAPQPAMPNPYDDPNAYNAQQQNMHYRPRGGGADDLLDAAGLSGGAAAGYAAAHQAYGQPQNAANLGRNPSLGPSQASAPSDYSSSYAQHPQGGYQQGYNAYQDPNAYNPFQQAAPPQGYQPQPYGSSPPRQQSPTPSGPRPTSMVDPYGGYVDEPVAAAGAGAAVGGAVGASPHSSPGAYHDTKAPSPPPERLLSGNFASPPASSEGHEENRMSYRDDDDYGYEPKRVLKVANE
ncbi:hypothetical protein C8Q76DRAFT_473068 [Earliella scabrosa]|nr:hypothetical protein C8Q76DRAFT_473068 [Earliella scabrosa]